MAGRYPYVHTWDEDGTQRQAQIHQTDTGDEVVWSPRQPGDHQPWVNLEHNGDVRHSNDEIDDDYEPEDD